MADLLSSLAAGLRGAGSVFSGNVYNQEINQRMAEDAFRRRLALQQLEQAQKDEREKALAQAVGPHLGSGNLEGAARAAATVPGGFGVGMQLLGQAEARKARIEEAQAKIEARKDDLARQHEFRMDELRQRGADAAVLAEERRRHEVLLKNMDIAGREAMARLGATLRSDTGDFQRQVGNEGKIRDDFNQLSKTFIGVRDAHQRVLASGSDPTAAGDLALIFNYMKVLDPTSVVRESEFAQAASTGAYGERIKAYVNKVIKGERLSDEIRKDFVARSQKLYDAAEANQVELEGRFKAISERSRVNPENVIIPYRLKKEEKKAEPASNYIEIRVTPSGKKLGKKADGTIEEVKE